MSGQKFKLIKLEQDNYIVWKWQFKNVANSSGLGALFGADASKITAATNSDGLSLLGSALSDENILKIINCTSFKQAWSTLEQCFENKTTYEPQALFRRLNSYKIDSARDVSKGISEIRGIVAQLRNLDEVVSDNNLIGAILSALPESFKIFVSIWKNSSDQNVDSLISKLMAEANEQASEANEEASALVAKAQWNDKGKGKKGGKGRRQQGQRSRDNDECRYCKELGHWLVDCPKRDKSSGGDSKQDREKSSNKNTKGKARKDESASQDDFAMTTVHHKIASASKFIWVADSGCTIHMSPHKDLFESIQPVDIEWMYTASSGSKVPVLGQGHIKTTTGTLVDVLYIPDLRQNLFSISAAAKRGITSRGEESKMVFYHNGSQVFEAKAVNNLYLIQFKPRKSAFANAATLEDWHARFGHASSEAIKLMHKNNIVEDLNIVSKVSEKCVGCQLNKCTRATHQSRTTPKAKLAGSVLHVDTAGPMQPSLAGSKYMVLCKDEASSYRLVAFVASKDQVAAKVKMFVTQAIVDTGNQVHKIVSDNGSEYVNAGLTGFLEQRGIIHERSVPYVPQQNGLVERDIRTIKEGARTMLNQAGLEMRFWAEAVNATVYVLNRVITSTDKSKTPYESWFGSKPSVKNLHVFGEAAVLKKPDRTRSSTWDEKGSQVIFMGYTNRFNTFRFWDQERDKIIISCDVVFLNKTFSGADIQEARLDEEHWVTCDGQGDDQPEVVHQGVNEQVLPQPSGQAQTRRDQFEESMEFSDAPTDHSGDQILNPQAERRVRFEPGEAQQYPLVRPASPELQPDPIVVDIRGVKTGVKGVSVMPYEEANNFVQQHSGKEVTCMTHDGPRTLKIGDLRYSQSTQRWKDASGGFVSRSVIKVMKDAIERSSRSNFAIAYLTASQVQIPKNHSEAMASEYSVSWKDAMDDEMASLVENQVFTTIPRAQASKRPVGSRWVFTVKSKPSGQVEKFKARVVAKGFTQAYGIDFTETYCSVVQIMTTRLVLAYAATTSLKVRQFDIRTAFLYGSLEETIYMDPPEGYGNPGDVWLLNRSLYGLKQSPRMWNQRFSDVLSSLGLQVSQYDHSVFYQLDPIIIVIVYVDDGLIFAKEDAQIVEVLSELKKQFKMRELEVNIYRGLQIKIADDGIFVHQEAYTKKVLQTFEMDQAKPSNNPVVEADHEIATALENKPYRSIVGSLAYLADTSRPDIAFAVNRLARQMASPTESSWQQAKQVLRYLVGTTGFGIWYPRGDGDVSLIGYSDSDFAGDKETSKSTTGYVVMTNDSPIHWKTQLQRHVTLSSTEAEVIALCALSKELSWIRRMMIELQMMTHKPSVIKCDNESAMKIVRSEKATTRTRHLRAQDAYVREQTELGELKLEHVRSEWQLADMLTKVLQTGKFQRNKSMLLVDKQKHYGDYVALAQRGDVESRSVLC